jgi:pimeloyl-ACP methyl ester carboxylesterase
MSTNYLSAIAREYTVYVVSRKPKLPQGYTMRDMSEDYAVMIQEEFGGAVDIMGLSTGGPIAQFFALDHPDLVRRLVLASTGYRLTDDAKELQLRVGELARQGKWGRAYSCLITGVYTRGIKKLLFQLLTRLFGGIGAPEDAADGLVEIEAEDKHNFKDQLNEIKVPTLVIGGDEDFFYPIKETADGIPDATLILYQGLGHNAVSDHSRQFGEDILAFLKS